MGKILGGGGAAETDAQKIAKLKQADELKRLKKVESKQIQSSGRKRAGRASLISGAETGSVLSDTLG